MSAPRADSPAVSDGLPAFHELSNGDRPPGSAWGVFGRDDEIGTANLLTAERVRHAAALVRAGKVFSLNWDLELPGPAILGRGSPQHEVIRQEAGFDDRYTDFYPQASSQWDSLAHVRHPHYGHYNGFSADAVNGKTGRHLGIHTWARRGIVGRFVLADIARYREERGTPLDPGQRTPVLAREVQEVLRCQDVALEGGDILLLHFGWTQWYERLSQAQRDGLADGELFPAPGLANEPETAAWLWDARVAAVAADCPAVEAMPFDLHDAEGFLHYRLIPLLGMALGEMFDLSALAADCAADGRYEGLLTAAPLNLQGGIGSPANALALK